MGHKVRQEIWHVATLCSGAQAETRQNKIYRIHSSEKVLNTQILQRHFFYKGTKENDSQLEAMAQHWEHNKQTLNKFLIFRPLVSMYWTKCSLNDINGYKIKLSFSKLHRSDCFAHVQYRRLPTILDS